MTPVSPTTPSLPCQREMLNEMSQPQDVKNREHGHEGRLWLTLVNAASGWGWAFLSTSLALNQNEVTAADGRRIKSFFVRGDAVTNFHVLPLRSICSYIYYSRFCLTLCLLWLTQTINTHALQLRGFTFPPARLTQMRRDKLSSPPVLAGVPLLFRVPAAPSPNSR